MVPCILSSRKLCSIRWVQSIECFNVIFTRALALAWGKGKHNHKIGIDFFGPSEALGL